MKIMYITDAFAIKGGIERVIADKLNYFLTVYGYNVCLLTSNQGNHPHAYPLNPSVRFVDVGISFHQLYRYNWLKRWIKALEFRRAYMQRVRNQIELFSPDIIITARPYFIKYLCRLRGNSFLILESHNICLSEYYEGCSFYKRMIATMRVRQLKNIPMQIIALTEGDAYEWRKLKPKFGVEVIPNIVHLNSTGNYSTLNRKHIIFVGRLERHKGLEDLLRIWQVVQKQHDDWHLDICGSGSQKTYVMSAIRESQLNVKIWDSVDNIIDFYMGNSILLLTSFLESFGLVILEAMSYGLPVVAFDCPYGPAEIITDGVDGFLIKNRDIKAFADRVCQLIEDKELRQRMGKSAIHSSQRYTPERIMPLWKELFESRLRK